MIMLHGAIGGQIKRNTYHLRKYILPLLVSSFVYTSNYYSIGSSGYSFKKRQITSIQPLN
jgi:hypothetical protein